MRDARAVIPDGAEDACLWPPKCELFGVGVSVTDYEGAAASIMRAAHAHEGGIVDHMSVHGLADASRDESMRTVLNSFDMVAPDGHSVRWAMNHYCGTRLDDRVYGPEIMQRLCGQAAANKVPIYLYGGSSQTVGHLRIKLLESWPDLLIAGCESPPFRPLTPEEDHATVNRINESGAGLVFLGLGCPKQELFAYAHREKINAVQICVGAAFDFLAGRKKMAPRWIQDRGLEWLFRLLSEPRRLWRRYLVGYATFWTKAAQASLNRRKCNPNRLRG
jgi:exopolysaccharide biosynthesis WecB/TagA/CpsF family protein